MLRRQLVPATALCLILAACGSSTSSATASARPTPTAAKSATASTAPASAAPSPTAAVAAPCTKRALKFDPAKIDLTGAWLGNDEGIYYIRQLGKVVWWSGMSGQAGNPEDLGRDWNNVATGALKDDMTLDLQW
jgi:hypothetical protein